MTERGHAYTPDDDGDELLPIGETAKALGVTVATVRNWDRAGHITAERTPTGHRRFRRSEVRRILAGGRTTEAVTTTTEANTATR